MERGDREKKIFLRMHQKIRCVGTKVNVCTGMDYKSVPGGQCNKVLSLMLMISVGS